MKFQTNPNWMSSGIQAQIKTLQITFIKSSAEEERASNIIKVRIRLNPESETSETSEMSETYSLKIAIFENCQPED